MKLSATDPEASNVKRVTVDGVDVTNRCASVDTELGWAVCLTFDDKGNIVAPNGFIQYENVRGNIEIEWRS